VLQATVLIVALMVMLANLITDIVYGWLDPRIRYS
jgi:ABC-type dipeptide/oligopeptide/nickel transport system permease component